MMTVPAGLVSLSGISLHRSAFLLRVSAPSGLNWLRTCAQEPDETPQPTGQAILWELDERGHDLKNQRRQLWLWKALDPETGQLLDWEGGRRDQTPLKKRVKRLAQWDVQRYGPEQGAA